MGYLERLDSYRDDMLRTLKESVSMPSVKADPVRTAEGDLLPYGRGVHDSLMHILGVGAAMGFESHNVDNYAGFIDCKAAEDKAAEAKTFGIVGHLDVVPVGAGWKTDPFEMVEEDGYLYGRGTSDDTDHDSEGE